MTVLLAVAFTDSLAFAGEVDLTYAGCPEFPPAADGVFLTLVLNEDGTAEECRIQQYKFSWCSNQAYDSRPGFICVDFTAQTEPDGNHAEGSWSKMTESFVVDGIPAEVRKGYSYWNFHRDFGTGPSGENYDVIVEQFVGERLFTVILGVTGIPDKSIEIRSLRITFDE